MKAIVLTLGLFVLTLTSFGVKAAAALPKNVGDCTLTTVYLVTTRLEGANGKPIPDTGSAILFDNGLQQVSYDQVPAVDDTKKGDKILICLVALPQDCPPGDDRGKSYTTTNLRTVQSWTLPDSAHGCGGA